MAEPDLYKDYLEYRQYLLDRHVESARSFDRAVNALAGGALLLSVTFVDQIIGDDGPTFACALLIAWGSLALSLLANLTSIWAAERDYFESVKSLDAAYAADRFPDHLETLSRFEKWVPGLNRAALISFIIGVVFLVIFALVNLGGGK